ncbi:hypothetical protein JOE59_003242 [Agromyces cerinus]|uniref:hypothetical protein n=1 Tax=Agromyces cerinus TaxID=33878 RepID=UPI00195A4487|nr:hypothetical protein [Agromyces cerinus]MBM7832537.1 hypothetical protein [Agromyces cerinus]
MNRRLLLMPLVLALALTGCQAGPEPQAQTPAVTAEPTPTPEIVEDRAPDGTASRPYAFGTYARTTPASYWDATITEPQADATEAVIAENADNQVEDGWQYVAGRMTTEMNENITDADEGRPGMPTSVQPVFVGSDGQIYDIWNDDDSTVVLTEDWIGTPTVAMKPGVTSTGRFAIQVPTVAVAGGRFAVQNEVSGDLIYFGELQP